ncbi:MAG: glycosyltransferase [Bacteroidia bacterium]
MTTVFRNKQISVIRNPVDSNIFNINENAKSNLEFKVDQTKSVILFVAENPEDERKGLMKLLLALEVLQSKKHELFLMIIGNLKSNIILNIPYLTTGIIQDEKKLANIYNLASLFVIPSLEDNLPNTVSEALLCGTPVVGYDIGGLKEMVVQGVNGFLCNPIDELANTLNLCINSNFSRKEVRKTAIEKLNDDILLSQFLTVYDKPSFLAKTSH